MYAQDYMWHWQNYKWHWQIHLLTFTIELFLDMTLAYDPTFIEYPLSKTFTELIFTNLYCNFLEVEIPAMVAQLVKCWIGESELVGSSPNGCIFFLAVLTFITASFSQVSKLQYKFVNISSMNV